MERRGRPPGETRLDALARDLERAFRDWGEDPAADAFTGDGFGRWAMEVHEAQRESNSVLRAYWHGRGQGSPTSWEEVPPVPTAAFRSVPIVTGVAEALFRTSGTTGGRGSRGEHHVASLALYRAAARGPYRRSLLKEGGPFDLLCLVPSPAATPDSSLATMAGFLSEEPEIEGTTWAFDPVLGVDLDLAHEAAAGSQRPLLMVATAFALTRLLDDWGEGAPFPAGSRIMETGGFKGRVRDVSKKELYERISRILGVPSERVVNEYGMTELLSQAYDGACPRAAPPGARVHRFPPWVRTRALDPESLEPLPPGERGLLAHFDLAGALSVCHVLTEDMGQMAPEGGFRLYGRAEGSSVRGCSLMAEAFLHAARPA